MTNNIGYYLMPHPPIIIPEVGKGEEKKIQKTINACKKIGQEVSSKQPDTIIVITSHGPVFSDAIALTKEDSISGSLAKFQAPDVKMDKEIDLELTDTILSYANEGDIQTVGITNSFLKHFNREFELDHGSIIPLYFIDQFYQDYKIVHITYGMLTFMELYQFGIYIKEAIKKLKRNCVIIASGDLSHRLSSSGPYSYSPKGKLFDDAILSHLESGNTQEIFKIKKSDITEAGECGYRSILVLLGALGKFTSELLSYEGVFGVGYGVMAFQSVEDKDFSKELKQDQLSKFNEKVKRSDHYVKLARESLNYYFQNKKLMDVPLDLPEELINTRKGVFVSLKKYGDLRGCIGTFLPTTQSVAHEIIHNAVEAAFKDPRFAPLEEKELLAIDISVDVLSEPTKATLDDLNPRIFGIIVAQGRKRGLLLPDLDGVDTIEEQINVACKKAGINPNKHFDLERFQVERHIEGEL